MNVLKRCFYGFSIMSLAFVNIQCKGNQKEENKENTTQKTDSVSIEKKNTELRLRVKKWIFIP